LEERRGKRKTKKGGEKKKGEGGSGVSARRLLFVYQFISETASSWAVTARQKERGKGSCEEEKEVERGRKKRGKRSVECRVSSIS